ncbi:hypothetical protein FB45DRAFT_1038201 [Roridomyces roridus]|uniref:F-box domain-containing protein n=1 Tax=Roridomyces roridus TaxID=1738132 RepID=A0AAD7B4Z7_9AGAR|nr:hypothetical protein FB45DRAFT_1038201 [Roridomyces roridus]
MLSSLNEDVVELIFTFCDVSTVNKTLHAIASSGPVWLSLARNLSGRGLLDLPDDLADASALKDEVRRAVIGPRTWHPTSTDPITVLRETTIPLGASHTDAVDLLPDGRYVVRYVRFYVEDHHRGVGVELWDVHSASCVWRWEKPDYTVARAIFDFSSDQATVVYLACGSQSLPRFISVLEITLNLSTRFPLREAFYLEIGWDVLTQSSHQIAGDFLAFQLCTAGAPMRVPLILIHWRTEEFILFDCLRGPFRTHPTTPVFALVHGYLFLAKPPAGDGNCIEIDSIPSLASFWRPLSSLHPDSTPTEPRPRPQILRAPGDEGTCDDDSRYITVSAVECPVHHGTYDLTVEIQNISPRFSCHLTRYHFRPNTEPVLRSTFHHSMLYTHPSGAGYAISWESMKSRPVIQFRKLRIGRIFVRRMAVRLHI